MSNPRLYLSDFGKSGYVQRDKKAKVKTRQQKRSRRINRKNKR